MSALAPRPWARLRRTPLVAWLVLALAGTTGPASASRTLQGAIATLRDSSAEVLFQEPVRYAVIVRDLNGTRLLRTKGDSLLGRAPRTFLRIERVSVEGVAYRTDAGGPLRRVRVGAAFPELPGFVLERTALLEHLLYRYRTVERISNPDPALVRLHGGGAVLELETTPRPRGSVADPASGDGASEDGALLRRMRIRPVGPQEYELHRGEMRVILDNAGRVLSDLKPFVLPILSLHAGLQFRIHSPASDGILGKRGFAITSPKLTARAGLEEGDLIRSVNGQPVTGFGSLFEIYQELKRDTGTLRIDIELERGGRRVVQTYWLR